MKKLLNTLYVTREKAYLSKEGQNVVIAEEGLQIGRYPIHILNDIICFSYLGMSPALIRLCSENNVGISFLTPQGKFCGRVVGKENGNVLLRRKQYQMVDSEASTAFVRNIIYAKGLNSKRILRRCILDHGDKVNITKLEEKIKEIDSCLEKIKVADEKDAIRGYEGAIAKTYFDCFDELILQQKADFPFSGRSKRPPEDNVNSMLSLLYTFLAHDIGSALSAVGIDSYVGFMHTDRPGRMSMALDVMEELRGFMADRTVLSMINLKIIGKSDFEEKESSAVLIKESGRKKIIEYWQKRKQMEILHPYLKEKVKIGLLPHVQSMLLNSYIRGDLEAYPPFIIKE